MAGKGGKGIAIFGTMSDPRPMRQTLNRVRTVG